MKKLSYLITFLLFCCNDPGQFELTGRWIELTYPFDEHTVYWPTSDSFQMDTVAEGITEGGFYYAAYKFSSAEHGGTHLDAPVHFAKGKHNVDQIPLEQLIGKAVVIDVSEKALKEPDYQVTIEDLKNWEDNNGHMPEASIVLLRTGFGRYWPDREKYMGTNERGTEAVKKLHFPGLGPKAAEWLTTRNIKAVGIDTPSIDYGQSRQFRSHQILFDYNIPAFENVANLDKLPAKGAWVIALPMHIKGGSGAPLRIVALIK